MSRTILEELEIPQPPYRMARPVASLASIDELPGHIDELEGKEADAALKSEQAAAAAGRYEAMFGESPEVLRAMLHAKVEEAVIQAPPKEAEIVQVEQDYLANFDIDFPQSTEIETDIGSRTIDVRETPEIKAAREAAEAELMRRAKGGLEESFDAEGNLKLVPLEGSSVPPPRRETPFTMPPMPGSPGGPISESLREAGRQASMPKAESPAVLDNKERKEDEKAINRAEGEGMPGSPASEEPPAIEAEPVIGSKNDRGEEVTGYTKKGKAIWEKPRGEEPLTSAPMPGSPGGMVTESLREAGSVAMQKAAEDEAKRQQKKEAKAAAKEAKAAAKVVEAGPPGLKLKSLGSFEKFRDDLLKRKARDMKAAPVEKKTPTAEQAPTGQEQRFAQLEEKIKQLEAQLAAAQQGGAGGEAPPGGGGEGEPPPPTGGGEEEPPSLERPTRIRDIGEQQGLTREEFWGFKDKAKAEGRMAALATLLARKWQARLERRNEKIKKWEASSRDAARKGMLGEAKAMAWDESWAKYHRWRGRNAYRKQEAWNDSRVRRENARNEILNLGGARIDRLLDSQYERIDQYALQRDEMDKELESFHELHKKITALKMAKTTPAYLQQWRGRVDALADKIRDASEKRAFLEELWQAERKRANRQQTRKDELINLAIRPTRSDTTPKSDYTWLKLSQRQTRPGGSPNARAGKQLNRNLAP